jgi:hypothetical protein
MDAKQLELLVLPGLYTGDMWHLAAATVISSHRKSPFNFTPITVMCISDFQDSVRGDPPKCGDDFLRGSGTFKYFRSIGVPILLAKINKANSSSSRGLFERLSLQYLQGILDIYKAAPNATFRATWEGTPAAPRIDNFRNEDVQEHLVIIKN